MRLAFLANSERYFGYASLMMESARKAMPGIYIVHLTDHEGIEHPEADETIKAPEGLHFGTLRMYHQARLHKDWIFCDVDILFRKNVWDVFEDDFDVACATREGSKWEKTQYAEVMPYNNGIVYSRGPAFWRELILGFDSLPEDYKKWGEQLLFNNLVASGRFKVKVLPAEYNFTPTKQDEDISDARVIHYKGNRKLWMGAT